MAIDRIAIPLPSAEPEDVGMSSVHLSLLDELVGRHIEQGHYPGAQYAVARNGKLVWHRTVGHAKIDPALVDATDEMLWLMFSQTKIMVAAALWHFIGHGAIRLLDRVADFIPEFAANGKGDITIFDVITHQGGFPSAEVPDEAWEDHDLLRRVVSDFSLEWTPGSKIHYHGTSAHWVLAAVIEAHSGADYRDSIRGILEFVGLDDDIFVGVSEDVDHRCADIYAPDENGELKRTPHNTRAWRAAGVPGAGGYGTAAGLASFYQFLLAKGRLSGKQSEIGISPRAIQLATRNHTGDRVDESMEMPMHRGLGPHVRGTTPTIRGLGTLAHPTTYGHGGAGTSYSWADPDSGVSFSYLTNCMAPDPWHSARLDRVSNIVHASIVEL